MGKFFWMGANQLQKTDRMMDEAKNSATLEGNLALVLLCVAMVTPSHLIDSF